MKNLISLALVSLLSFVIFGCSDKETATGPSNDQEYVVLEGTRDEVEEVIIPQFRELVDMALNPKEKSLDFRIMTESDSYAQVIITYDTTRTSFPHPVIETAGNRMHIVLETKYFVVPVVRFYDDYGNRIELNGKEYEYNLDVPSAKFAQDGGWFNPIEWFSSDVIKFIGIGLAAWLGFKVGALILAVLASIAWAAVLIGLFVGAVTALPGAFQWIVEIFGISGWNIEAIRQYALEMGQNLTALLQQIM